jgi:hypothetical protein
MANNVQSKPPSRMPGMSAAGQAKYDKELPKLVSLKQQQIQNIKEKLALLPWGPEAKPSRDALQRDLATLTEQLGKLTERLAMVDGGHPIS